MSGRGCICLRGRGLDVGLGCYYQNTYVRGIYLICIRSRVGISVRAWDWGLMSGSELVLPSELLAVRLRG